MKKENTKKKNTIVLEVIKEILLAIITIITIFASLLTLTVLLTAIALL